MTASRKTSALLYAAGAAAAFAVAVCGPLDARADGSFAWHMLQHLLLLFAVPLFALLAHPLEWFGSPRAAWRRRLVRIMRSAPARALLSPVTCLAIVIGTLWGMHFTQLYAAALDHPLIHIGEHVLLLIAGTFFWIPVVAPPPFPQVARPVRALYLFLALPQGAFLAIALLAARAPLYAHYAGPGAMADQHAAAAVMWVGGGAVVLIAFLAVIAQWAARERYAAVAVVLAVVAAGFGLQSPAGAVSTATPSYAPDQARAGQTLFYEHCAECHGDMLQGRYGPALSGRDGNLQWESVQYVFQYVTGHMPVGDADGLTSEQYVDIMAFLLKSHRHPAGSQPLTAAAANASLSVLGPL